MVKFEAPGIKGVSLYVMQLEFSEYLKHIYGKRCWRAKTFSRVQTF